VHGGRGHGVLHSLIHRHLEAFLAEARARGEGDGLPRFVERELREFVTCGHLARGFRPLPLRRVPPGPAGSVLVQRTRLLSVVHRSPHDECMAIPL